MFSHTSNLLSTWYISFKSVVSPRKLNTQVLSRILPVALELTLILLWAMWAGHEFLNSNPNAWPAGNEFPLSVRENYFWRNLLRCGTCAMWNGSMDGGYPALVDLQGAPLHPLAAIPTLLFGVINGGKVSIVLGLALAGLAQWWLGRLVGTRWFARLWAALLAVVAGSIVGRMESGLVTLVISTASAALVIPAVLNLWQRPNPRSTVLLAVALAGLVMSGQGYMQLVVVLGLLPALIVLCIGPNADNRAFLKHLLQSGILATMLAGIFLVPLLNQGGQMVKDLDPSFSNLQPLEYQPVNLIVRDPQFFRSGELQKTPYPVLFVNYVGWVPVLLATLALRLVPREKTRLLSFFIAAIVLVFLNSSLILPKLVFGTLAPEFLMGIRHPSIMAGLAAPLILGLAAWGLDYALKSGPLVNLIWTPGETNKIRLTWVLLAIPLAWALSSAFIFSQDWLYIADQPAELDTVMDAAKSNSARWVEFPSGELYWSLYALERDIKISPTFHPWHFREREFPTVSVFADRVEASPDTKNIIISAYGMVMTKIDGVEYAAVQTIDKVSVPCQTVALGGTINLHCTTYYRGRLVIAEHAWPGWSAWDNNQPIDLLPGEEWLSIDLPAGDHQISLRYLPWDVPVGLLVSLMAIGAAVWMWIKTPSPARAMESGQEGSRAQAKDGQDAGAHGGDDQLDDEGHDDGDGDAHPFHAGSLADREEVGHQPGQTGEQ